MRLSLPRARLSFHDDVAPEVETAEAAHLRIFYAQTAEAKEDQAAQSRVNLSDAAREASLSAFCSHAALSRAARDRLGNASLFASRPMPTFMRALVSEPYDFVYLRTVGKVAAPMHLHLHLNFWI